MNLNAIAELNDGEILQMYDEVVSLDGSGLIAGCNHLIRCDNGKYGYFCLKGQGACYGQSGYGCETPTQYNCYYAGSIGCYCGTGYRCGTFNYVGGC